MAFEFDGSTGAVLRLDSAMGITDQPFTMAVWWKSNNTAADSEYFSMCEFPGGNFWAIGHRSDGTYKVRFRDQNELAYGSAMGINQWYHTAAAVDSVADVYLDGVGIGTSVGSMIAVPVRTSLGRLDDGTPSNHANGHVAEAAVWNLKLTADEIHVLSRGYSPLFVRPRRLVYYAPLAGNLTEWVGGVNLTEVGSPPGFSPHPPIIYPSESGFPASFVAPPPPTNIVGAGVVVGEHSMGRIRRLVR